MLEAVGMATYVEYPAQSMAANDFTLYPYSEGWTQDQTYLPASTYADQQSYLSSTSFDTYPPQQAYAPLQHQFDYTNDQAIAPTKSHLRAPSPYRSPSVSAAHSFDYQHHQPAPSTISDSGASAQSTISSAIGSPASHPQSSDWNNSRFYPSIVQQPDTLYPTSTFDFDTISPQDKACVGESNNISSNLSFISPGSMPPISSSGELQSVGTFSSKATSASPKIFESPITPASAHPPVVQHFNGKHKSSLTRARTYTESEVPIRPKAPNRVLTSPYFSQSSGHFVPPLESSCSFPLSCFPIPPSFFLVIAKGSTS